MEITLEMIEQVKDRTGVTYKEAKEAIEFAGGNVVDAIIHIEENIDMASSQKDGKMVQNLIDAVRDAVKKGNFTKLRITKGEETLVNLPINVGILGTVLFPWGTVLAALATGVSGCKVELLEENGSRVDISEKVSSVYRTVKDKADVVVDEVKDKAEDIIRKKDVKEDDKAGEPENTEESDKE